MNVGNVLSYLSMQIMLEQGVVTIDMSYYLEKVLQGYDNLPPCSTLGKRNFFDVDERVELLLKAEHGRSSLCGCKTSLFVKEGTTRYYDGSGVFVHQGDEGNDRGSS